MLRMFDAKRIVALIVVAILAAVPVAAPAQDSGGNGIVRELGDLFRDVLKDDTAAPKSQPSVPESRAQINLSFAPLVKESAPAVVNVYAERMVRQRSPFAGDPFFEQFFGQQFQGRPRRSESLGSGVVVAESGIVLTNNHVIEDADKIRVALQDGREFDCTVLLKDARYDLAVLKIQSDKTFETIEIGDSDAVEVGDLVLAIGNPFGVGQTVTSGIVSALARNQVGVSDFGFFIQTDAAINPGNSGGALIDMSGRLIGINTAIFSRSGGSNGIGFAIPANLVKAVALAAEGGSDQFDKPYVGADFEPVTSEIADALGLDRTGGALVSSVIEGGPAERAGLMPGDVVVALDGRRIEHPDALGYRLATAGIGHKTDFQVIRRNKLREVTITTEAPPAPPKNAMMVIEGDNPFAGAVVATLSPGLADNLRLPHSTTGVAVVDVDRRSHAARLGLRPRDIILKVNGTDIDTADRLQAVLDDKPMFWRFEIDRGGRRIKQIVR